MLCVSLYESDGEWGDVVWGEGEGKILKGTGINIWTNTRYSERIFYYEK